MKFFTTVVTTNPDKAGDPPPELGGAIAGLIGESAEILRDVGEMKTLGTVTVENGEIVVDGPHSEAREPVAGFAIFEFPSEEAIFETCRKFAEVHRTHWPAWDGKVIVRQLMSMGSQE